MSGSELVVVVDGLEEFVEYNFTIRAYTIAGPVPFSDVTTSLTGKASEGNGYLTKQLSTNRVAQKGMKQAVA